MINDLLKDGEVIASKYNTNVVEVLTEFVRFEYIDLRKNVSYDYSRLIGKTTQHFKDKFYAHKRVVDYLMEMF